MPPFRNWFTPSGRMLTRRLEQLRTTLDSLGARLRAAVAQAVGETVGVVIRDAVSDALDGITGLLPEPPPQHTRPPQGWPDDDAQELWEDGGWDDYGPPSR